MSGVFREIIKVWLATLSLAFVAAPLAAQGQQPAKAHRIGYLSMSADEIVQ
jgi:hypothetical protein